MLLDTNKSSEACDQQKQHAYYEEVKRMRIYTNIKLKFAVYSSITLLFYYL